MSIVGERRPDGATAAAEARAISASIEGPCPNCGDPTQSRYCPNCGQRRSERRISLRRMLMEALEDQFAVNPALPRTIRSLLLQPGHLTREYVSGRIQRYIPPFRLYLVSSIVFFLLLTFNMSGIHVSTDVDLDAAVPGDSSQYVWGERVQVRIAWPVLDTLLVRRIDELRRIPFEQAKDQVLDEMMRRAPTVVFLMLPVFALLLKLLYIRRRRYYVEHFVFGLHTHAFTFLIFSIILLSPTNWVDVPAVLWLLLYFFLAMKRFYGQGFIRTSLKYVLLFNLYGSVIGVGIAALIVGALLLS